MNNKKDIREFIEKAVADSEYRAFFREPLTGFASAADPLFEEVRRLIGPHHFLPREVLPEAKTVVSYFLPFADGLVKGNRGPGPVSRDWGVSYVETNRLINRINQDLKALMETRGFSAATLPATHNFDEITLESGWSHRSSAYIAGLGRFGLNRMLIGPRGGAGRYGTFFISAELEPDRPAAEDYCLYNQNGGCQACLKACPVGALTLKGFDKHKCYAHLLANSQYLDLGTMADACGKCAVAGPCALGSS